MKANDGICINNLEATGVPNLASKVITVVPAEHIEVFVKTDDHPSELYQALNTILCLSNDISREY